MPSATDLATIKSVSQGDDKIQALHDPDPVVVFALDLAEEMAPEGVFGAKTKFAQTYLAAHILSLAFTVAGGQGPLSSETIGGLSQSFTLPYLNQTTVIASTQYGVMYLDLVRSVIVPVRTVAPA